MKRKTTAVHVSAELVERMCATAARLGIPTHVAAEEALGRWLGIWERSDDRARYQAKREGT